MNSSSSAPVSRRRAGRLWTVAVVASAIAFVAFYTPERALATRPFADVAAAGAVTVTHVAANALGRSGAVQVQFALPGARVQSPISAVADSVPLRYVWRRATDSLPVDTADLTSGDSLTTPDDPGLYQLMLIRDGLRGVVDGLTLAVLVPFDEKNGPVLDGYRIGTYLAEKGTRRTPPPEGFVKVLPDEESIPISKHLTLGDFLTRDGQTSWPRFAAVNPKVLDKLELVVEKVSERLGESDMQVQLSVHSGFRAPAYNRTVRRAARDSRHQYGDAVDVAIDANGDGRLDARDTRIVAATVDEVEREYPDLVGGMGLYTSRRYAHPYVHIDARGTRARWHG